MKVGVFTLLTAESLAPSRLAREIVDRGYESLFLPENTHIPVGVETGPAGDALPEV